MMTVLRFLVLLSSAMAWVVPPRPMTSTRLAMSNVRGISLESLQDHHEEGILMSKSIVAWLDTEVRVSFCVVVLIFILCFLILHRI